MKQDETDPPRSLPPLLDCLHLGQVDQISAGRFHMGALRRNGELYMWGKGEVGQLGLGNKQLSSKVFFGGRGGQVGDSNRLRRRNL